MTGCDRRGVLSRTGTAQTDRDPVERDAQFFRLDERDVGDLILFARRFARHLKYYDPSNVAAGDWAAWFDRDISAILASLAKLPVDPFRAAMGDMRAFLEDDPARPEAELRSHFNGLLHLPLTLYREMAERQAAVSPDDPLWPILQQLARTDIAGPLAELAGYQKGAEAEGLVPATALNPADFNLSTAAGPGPRLTDQVAGLLFTGEVFGQMTIPLRAVSGFAPTGWADYHTAQPVNSGPYVDAPDTYGKIFDALNHNLLVSSIERVFRAMARTRAEAEARLVQSLEEFAAHTPHYALWLAFLSMFDKARVELNDFTGRHLDFYYEEILRLARRGPVADHVHVTFELSKGREAHLVPAGTALRGGKDDLGNEVTYLTDEDIVVNQATVADTRAMRVDSWTVAGDEYATVRVAPVAASLDGLGEEDLPEEAPHFAPFGPDTAPFGRFGFAISDRQLFLREGTRAIVLTTELDATLDGGDEVLAGLMVRLTAEEDWLDIPAGDTRLTVTLTDQILTIRVALDGAAPPIVHHDPEIHLGPYPSDRPAMEVLFDFDRATDAAARSFARLRGAEFLNVALSSEASGLRLMSVRTADGVADPSDSFMPFGATPRKGARWIIGSSELFSKPQASVSLKVFWAETYNEDDYFLTNLASAYTIGFDYFKAGAWVEFTGFRVNSFQFLLADGTGQTTDPSQLGFEATEATITVLDTGIAATDAQQVLEEPNFNKNATTGFMRMTLKNDFGHDRFIDKKTLRLIEASKEGGGKDPCDTGTYNYDAGNLPLTPYTPEIEAITLAYTSRNVSIDEIWHVFPFGAAPRPAVGPVLDPTPFEGALYLGIDALDPPESLALLVQVANGTGDPLLENPDLQSFYLSQEAWQPFERRDIVDRTDNFAGSGLLAYGMPRAADPGAGLMPGPLHWLRIAAPQNAGAVNRILSVSAQAVRATFADDGNDPAFLEVPLPPETIGKLKVPDRAVKSVAQPYPSFGGRGQEDLTAYHRRASERLRHKDRAVTIWDYEHLSLEAFPELYRVKALNTTELQRSGGVVVADNEVSPGAVTLVAVPYTQGRAQLDPLRPYTDKATLAALDAHARRRQSPFVRFETANPKFEEIHVDLNVAFLPHITDLDFYRDQLQIELIAHLTPWQQAAGQGVEFGGIVYKSTIIDFVEELPYVDFLEDVRMYHRPSPDVPAWTKIDAEIARASTARSVLVSARTHEIEVLT